MPKLNPLRTLIQSFTHEDLVSVIEKFGRKNKPLQAFLTEHSTTIVDTHKSLQEWREELNKLVQKSSTPKRKVAKISRLERNGLKSLIQMSESMLKKGNLADALNLNLALLEALQNVVIANTKVKWNTPPIKKILKYFTETQARFDSAIKLANPLRQKRQPILKVLLTIWINQHQINEIYLSPLSRGDVSTARRLDGHKETEGFGGAVVSNSDLLAYAPRDEDQVYLLMLLTESLPQLESNYERFKSRSAWRFLNIRQFNQEHPSGKQYQKALGLKSQLEKMTKI
jgi:hypothetical protein